MIITILQTGGLLLPASQGAGFFYDLASMSLPIADFAYILSVYHLEILTNHR
jgi:hypothetical protein